MKRGDFLQRWGLASLKLNLGFVEGEFFPSDPDTLLLLTDNQSAWDKAMADLGTGLRELESAVVLRPLTLTVNVVRDKTTSTTVAVKK